MGYQSNRICVLPRAVEVIKPDKIKLTNAKCKWGSCNSKRVISLNWRLIMLSPELIDYVIVHELSHFIHPNHSSDFWSEVEKYYPYYFSNFHFSSSSIFYFYCIFYFISYDKSLKSLVLYWDYIVKSGGVNNKKSEYTLFLL